ncbi:MAG: NUDIX hydrolase [Gemmatimonadales bacterium]|nr:NUDIX hydrolase [Gemmatimonadales bacterium]
MALLQARRLYTGRVLNLDLDTVRFPDGSTGELEMIRHPGAAAILPFVDPPDRPDPRVLLIRQFRHAADGVVWEIPAGRREPGERPEACAHRELEEETGWRATVMEPLLALYTTPGFTDEVIWLYRASGLVPGQAAREADEFVEVHTLRWTEVMALARAGGITDSKTLTTLLFVQCFLVQG